jgi:Glucose-6-phosphate dehydrogenase, NAD binding domain
MARKTVDAGKVDPCVLAVFGVTGDLSKRLLFPSLYNLACAGTLPDDFRLLGVGRRDWTDQVLRRYLTDSLGQFWGGNPDRKIVRWLAQRTYYQNTNFRVSICPCARGRPDLKPPSCAATWPSSSPPGPLGLTRGAMRDPCGMPCWGIRFYSRAQNSSSRAGGWSSRYWMPGPVNPSAISQNILPVPKVPRRQMNCWRAVGMPGVYWAAAPSRSQLRAEITFHTFHSH